MWQQGEVIEVGGATCRGGNLQLDSFLHIQLLKGNLPINLRNFFVRLEKCSWISGLKGQTEYTV